MLVKVLEEIFRVFFGKSFIVTYLIRGKEITQFYSATINVIYLSSLQPHNYVGLLITKEIKKSHNKFFNDNVNCEDIIIQNMTRL